MTPPHLWPPLDEKLLGDAAATFNFRLGLPSILAVTPDGSVLFRRTPPRAFAADLFELNTRFGTIRTLATADDLLGTEGENLSDAEKARRERTRTVTRGVVDIDVSDDGRVVMIPLGGKLYLLDRFPGGALLPVDPGGPAYDPHLSPDGSRVAFVRDGDLWVVSFGRPAVKLTSHPEGFEYGVAEFAAQEELDRRRGFWWAPDGKSIVFQRTDAREVDTLYVSDPRHPDRPPVPFKYPRAGRNNAVVDLGVVPAAGGDPVWLTWDLAAYPYLARVSWPAKGPLTAVVLDRRQTDLAVLAFDLPGAGTPRVLFTEHDDAWINVGDGGGVGLPRPGLGACTGAPCWLPDGSGFLWMTESRGAWTLELRAPDGKLVRPLTEPGLGLRALVGVIGGDAIVEASTDPLLQDVLRVPIAGGAPVSIAGGTGVSVGAADNGVIAVQTAEREGGRTFFVIAPDGKRHAIPSAAERPSLVPTTRFETVDLGGRTHHVAITRPRDFDPGKRYPVLLKVYAGPHLMTVVGARDTYLMDQWYADAGFVVVRSDGRGTPNRGRDWERAVLRDLITVPLEDQSAALLAIGARHPEMDLSRVGVTGWSFGGYFAAMAVLLRPDLYKAAVAGAPVTDWTLYDTAYTERYMKLPSDNAEGYAHTSALTHASKLTRPLLVIHGITDDNVHFAHALALIEALYVAGKRAEMITLSATHMVPDPKLNFAREKVQVDFFRQHLGE